MKTDLVNIRYRFHLPSHAVAEINLAFEPESFRLVVPEIAQEEDWVALDANKCSHCPLSAATTPWCPFAQAVARFIHEFDNLFSYDNVVVEVVTATRTIVAHGAIQNGLSSLVGLAGATSGCPHLAHFRTMAHFHLPFATEEETLFRAFSSEVLGQVVAAGADPATVTLANLRTRYEAVALVNMGMAARIRTACAKDAVVNGLIILDTFAQAAPYVIKDKLEELRYLFAARAECPKPGP